MLKVRKNFLYLLLVSLLANNISSEEDPYIFIDKNAQQMVVVLIENKSLFLDDRSAYEDKIKEIFEPMIDFKRVAAGVMGRQHYMKASPDQRNKFVDVFRNSLLDTYSETLAQWENQDIDTIFRTASVSKMRASCCLAVTLRSNPPRKSRLLRTRLNQRRSR